MLAKPPYILVRGSTSGGIWTQPICAPGPEHYYDYTIRIYLDLCQHVSNLVYLAASRALNSQLVQLVELVPESAWECKLPGEHEKYTLEHPLYTAVDSFFSTIMMHRIVFLDRIGPEDHESGLRTGQKLVVPYGKCISARVDCVRLYTWTKCMGV
jgi:hypothetical protein